MRSCVYATLWLRNELEQGVYGRYVLIGDGGYRNTNYLRTPFTAHLRRPLTPDEAAYQRAIIAARNVVERQYGVLKRRFAILTTGSQMRRLSCMQQVVVACCILHNICIDTGDENPDDLDITEVEQDDNEIGVQQPAVVPEPEAVRNNRPQNVRPEMVEYFRQVRLNSTTKMMCRKRRFAD